MLPDDSGLAYFAEHGVDEALLGAGFDAAMARGADYAELFFEHTTSHAVGLVDGAVNRASTGVTLGVGVRVVRGDQTGYAYTEELTPARVREAAATAAIIASGPSRLRPEAYAMQSLPSRYRAEQPWDQVELQRKIPLLHRLNDAAFALNPAIKKVRVGFDDRTSAILIVDSTGRISFDIQPMGSFGVNCTAERDGHRESSGYRIAGREGFELVTEARLDRLAADAVDRTMFLFEATPAPAGELPLVLAAGAAGILLHEAIGHGMEADFNRKGTSVYSERLNTRIAAPDVSIVDDGTIDKARGAINVDDEGTLGQYTALVENGILRSYMHDKISAQHYGVPSTGNGRRQSFRHPPQPRMRCTYMLSGPRTPQEIIESVKFGVYAETFTNGQVNIGAGDFTFYIKTGHLIENGKLTRPIKDTNIIGNGPQVLERVDMVGNDLKMDDGGWTCGKGGQSVPVSQGMPTVRVSAVTIGGVGSYRGATA